MYSASIWEKETFFAPRDVIIAGSGLVGLWCAYYLKKKEPKLSILIVDRGLIPTGASTRNAGFACFGSVTELLEDVNLIGEDKMLSLTEMRFRGLQRITDTFKRKSIDFELRGGFEIITKSNNLPKDVLLEHIDWLNKRLGKRIGEKKIYELSDDKIGDFGFRHVLHLIHNKFEGVLHPGKLCLKMIKLLTEEGVSFLNATEVAGFQRTGGFLQLHNNQNIQLSTQQLLICTNGFARQLLPDLALEPARGQVLLTSEIENLQFRGAFHFDGGFYYFRNLGNRVLLGGARNKFLQEEATTEMTISSHIQDDLGNFLSDYILPGKSFRITDRWSGIMGMGPDKMPIIKKVSEGIFCAVRMSGMGIALAPVIGEQVAEMMLG